MRDAHDPVQNFINALYERDKEGRYLPLFDEYGEEQEMEKKYSAHEVAVILANAFGDDCACNFNDNDEWLPMVCDFRDTVCPNPCGVACWEQYLKHNPELLKEVEP
jgi:hypothetical protein